MGKLWKSIVYVGVGFLIFWIAVYAPQLTFNAIDYSNLGTQGVRHLQWTLLLIAFGFIVAPIGMDIMGGD